MSPVKSKRPRGSLAARRPVLSRRRSNPPRIVWDPRVQARTFETWNVVSNWNQLVPPAPMVWKLVTLTLGIPGLPNFVSPLKPGMPSDVPASACPFTANWFSVSKSMW